MRNLGASMVLAAAATLAGAHYDKLNAQAGKPPMSGMDTSASASMRGGMRGKMGATMPVGIMVGHAKSWMVGYQYMFENLDGLLDGSAAISQTDVLTRFSTTPTGMSMRMHMGVAMYSPTATFTVMAMLPYIAMSMGELHRDSTRSTERSSGIGDLALRGLLSVYATKDSRHRILANFGIILPTGSIDHPGADGLRLEYPMQTGAGTASLLPGVTYLGQALPMSWGAELSSTVRVGTNAHGYRLGNLYEPRVWLTRQVSRLASVSAGASSELWGNIHGSDASLDPTDEPTKAANIQGGKRVSASLGVTLHPASGFLAGQQALLEGDVPVVQSLNGPQLKTSYMLRMALQWAF